MTSTIKRLLIGRPLASDQADHQRISKTVGLAVFSSDAISSTAYATGEVMLVLVGVGGMAAATSHLVPIAILVILLLALVANSYRETIHAYPDGGGSYIVSRENLGETPSLVAGASLLIDYVLTVAVSIAAGTLAITSAFHELRPYTVWMAVGFLVILTAGNLRGLKESGRVFSVPTYFYIVMMTVFVGYGMYRGLQGTLPQLNPSDAPPTPEVEEHFGPYVGEVSALILARAFASGAVALTGVEAISNGIPAFRKPSPRNAAITLGIMAVILGVGFFGISAIAANMHPMPSEQESVISIMGRSLFGGGSLIYYLLQFSTFAILVLAANTAFADFPRLAAIISRDGYLPRQFSTRGDRLVFSNGILILAGLAGVLLIVFDADVSLLIPLYAVGVFTSFTLSQSGMVIHHLKERQKRWQLSLACSALGAVATFIVAAVVIISKFAIGAWIIVVAVPIVVMGFRWISRHYRSVGAQLVVDPAPEAPTLRTGAVVLVGGVNRSALMALRYARSIHADDLVAISVAIDDDHAEQLRARWNAFGLTVPLEIIESPYRDLTGVVIEFLDELDRRWGHDYISVILPEAIVPHYWQRALHNQSALALKMRLQSRRDTVVVSVPYHLADDPDQEAAIVRRRSGATLSEATGAVGEPYATNVGAAEEDGSDEVVRISTMGPDGELSQTDRD
ncbi:MAG TPA: APC family permease [Microthrixaceae bacterium]|nr:APC family permease [Microthrixaceae bacterium]